MYGWRARTEPRAALAALMTGDLDFYTATGTSGLRGRELHLR